MFADIRSVGERGEPNFSDFGIFLSVSSVQISGKVLPLLIRDDPRKSAVRNFPISVISENQW
jgi:hypothetical protein